MHFLWTIKIKLGAFGAVHSTDIVPHYLSHSLFSVKRLKSRSSNSLFAIFSFKNSNDKVLPDVRSTLGYKPLLISKKSLRTFCNESILSLSSF